MSWLNYVYLDGFEWSLCMYFKKVKRLVSENVKLPGWSMKIQMDFK